MPPEQSGDTQDSAAETPILDNTVPGTDPDLSEPQKTPDTEDAKGTSPLPEPAPGETPEISATPASQPETASTMTPLPQERSGDVPDAAGETLFSADTNPATDPHLSEPAESGLPDAERAVASDMPDAENAPVKTVVPSIDEDRGTTERAPDDASKAGTGSVGAEEAQPETAGQDVKHPADGAEPAGDADPMSDQPASDTVSADRFVSVSPAWEPAAPATDDAVPSPTAAAYSSTPPPPPAPKRSFFPLLLGGVLAGGVGFGAQTLLDQNAPAGPDIAALEAEIADLRAALAAQPAPADLSPLEAELAALRDQIADLPAPDAVAASEDLEMAVDRLRAEFAQAEGIDLAPLEARVQGLADLVAEQQSVLNSTDAGMAALHTTLDDTDARFAELQAELDDLRDLAERRVVEAESAIDAARAQSGLDSLRAALDTGAPYRDAIARLTDAGVAVPDELARPADSGIATLEVLQEGFDDAARNALRAAIQDAPAESATDRFGNFLRAQVGARSTVPRAGDDPDAVLSRASAAMEAGNLTDALAEIEALPDTAQAAMREWLSAARVRIAAQAALSDLTTAITTE